MSTLSEAKTIDLCNNPLTKTPKLEVAKQLLPEWTALDNRAKALGDTFAAQDAAKASGKNEKTQLSQQTQEQTKPQQSHVHEDL